MANPNARVPGETTPAWLKRLLAEPYPNFEYIRVVEGTRDNEARQYVFFQ